MDYAITSRILGDDLNLIVQDDSLSWVDWEPGGYVVGPAGSGQVSIDDLAQMHSMPACPELASDAHRRAFERHLGLQPNEIPWAMALRPDQLMARVKAIMGWAQDVLCAHEASGYGETYRQGQELLSSLYRATIDIRQLQLHLSNEVNPTLRSQLQSFVAPGSEPVPGGEKVRPPRTIYSRASTTTGRLTVVGGPNILTLPKRYKDIISAARDHTLVEVDFVSLEPRVALFSAGHETTPDDIYSDMCQQLSEKSGCRLDRETAKVATLSALYGSGPGELQKQLGGRSAAKEVLGLTKEYFEVESLRARLRQDLREGRLRNHFGRPLHGLDGQEDSHKLVNHFIQSTAVDVALLGFSSLLNFVKHLKPRPIYVIHDALLLEIPNAHLDEFVRICSHGVDIEMGCFRLGVKER